MESDVAPDQAQPEAEASAETGQEAGQLLTQDLDQASVPAPVAEAPAESAVAPAPTESAQAAGEDAALSSESAAAAEAVPAPAEPFAAFLAMVRRLLDRRKVSADVGVRVVRTDADGRGGLLAFHARSLAEAREAAGHAIYSADGREWKHVGSGPDLDSDRYHCYVHVSPLA